MHKLIGYRHSKGTNSQGQAYDGYHVYFISEIPSQFGEGYGFDLHKGNSSSVFLSPEEFSALALKVGGAYDFYYTSAGYIAKESIRPVK